MFTLICGHPRAGKTTYSNRYENVIHLDTDGLYRGVLQKVKRSSDSIVVEGVYNWRSQRIELLGAYNGKGKKMCIWLDTPKCIRQERTKAKVHDLPFEPPTYAEGWDEIVIMRDNDHKRVEVIKRGE